MATSLEKWAARVVFRISKNGSYMIIGIPEKIVLLVMAIHLIFLTRMTISVMMMMMIIMEIIMSNYLHRRHRRHSFLNHVLSFAKEKVVNN